MNRRQRRQKAARGPDAPGGRPAEGPGRPPPPTIRPALVAASRRQQAGDFAGASAAYHRILSEHPEQPHALSLLGSLLGQQGRPHEAIAVLERAVKADPRLPEAHGNLAVALHDAGRAAEAEAAFRRAIKLRPDFVEARCGLAKLLIESGRSAEAEPLLEEAVARRTDHAEAHHLLATALSRRGQNQKAFDAVRRAIHLRPAHRPYRHTEGILLSRLVPRWHFPMINETRRNEAYRRAIESAVVDGMHVLEIGTGSGLLAMMAARAGAAHVTTCEMVPVLAEKARSIVAANGFEDRITVLSRRSNDVVVGEDLPVRADLLVSEVLSEDFISEGVLPSINHARRELLTPRAPMIPRGGAVMGALVGPRQLGELISVGMIEGFDLSAFSEFAPRTFVLPHAAFDLELLSGSTPLLTVDLRTGAPLPGVVRATLSATQASTCIGLVQWIRADLDDDTVYENGPAGGPSHWSMIFYRFDHASPIVAGDDVTVEVRPSATGLQIDRVP